MSLSFALLRQPMPSFVLIAAGSSALLSWILLWWLIPWLRRQLLDQPNARSSHRIATPRGGGVVFVLVGSLPSLAWGEGATAWIAVMCCHLALFGRLDSGYQLTGG